VGQKLFWLAAAGGLGTLSRYALSGLVQRFATGAFPWGTLVTNGIGCLLFGIAWTIFAERFALDPAIRTLLLVGFLGAFTTFSTAIAETGQLMIDGTWLRAALYLVGGNLVGLGAFFAGAALGRIA
jgi:CrcB protein